MKDKSKMDISDLLAQRDRRLVDAQVLDQQDDLDELNRLTAEVQNQADVPDWMDVGSLFSCQSGFLYK